MADDEITQRAAGRGPMSLTDLPAGRRPDPKRVRESHSRHELPPDPVAGSPDVPAEVAPDLHSDLHSDVADTGQLYVTELLRREGRGDEPSLPARPSWVYRLVAALSCFALLSGAVLASTAALSGPRTERAAPRSPVPASIAGPEALRADLIDSSVGLPPAPAPGTGVPAARGPGVAPTGAPGRQPVPAERSVPNRDPRPPRTQPAPAPPPASHHQAGSAGNPVLDTVSAFYRNVAVSPRAAFALLDKPMRGSGYQEFRTGWTDVERVTVDSIRSDGPNAALVTVSLTRTDATVLHTMQRVLVTPGSTPRITDARLLSASRS